MRGMAQVRGGLFILLYTASPTVSGPQERKLLHDLITESGYNSLERPVFNDSEAINLTFGLTLQQIIDVNEKDQILTTNIWLNLEWDDINLAWNKSEYDDIVDIRLPPKYIWKPDLLMYNSADEKFDGTYPTNVVVTNEGHCTYIPPGIFKSTCLIDITWFPFDDQNCEMKFGSWTYNGFKLNLHLNAPTGDLASFVMNGEWMILEVPAKRNEVIYECCPEPYLDITYTIKMRRRTLYYFCNLIIPCILIASMAVLGFTLPPDSGEKLSLGVTILLSLTIFLNTVSEIIPITSDSPLIGTYFNCIMFMVASSVVTTIMILNYHHRKADTHNMPAWVRIIFLQWIPWFLRMSRPGEKITLKTLTIQSKMKELDPPSKSLLANVLDMEDDYRPTVPPPPLPPSNHHNHLSPPLSNHINHNHAHKNGGLFRSPNELPFFEPEKVTPLPSGTMRELTMILKELRVLTDKLKADEEDDAMENDWKFAAMVLDRLCLITFTGFTMLATAALLITAPHVIVT